MFIGEVQVRFDRFNQKLDNFAFIMAKNTSDRQGNDENSSLAGVRVGLDLCLC